MSIKTYNRDFLRVNFKNHISKKLGNSSVCLLHATLILKSIVFNAARGDEFLSHTHTQYVCVCVCVCVC